MLLPGWLGPIFGNNAPGHNQIMSMMQPHPAGNAEQAALTTSSAMFWIWSSRSEAQLQHGKSLGLLRRRGLNLRFCDPIIVICKGFRVA